MSACVSSWKVVQTELDPSSYGRLKLLADRKAQPIKAVLREAVQELLAREEGTVDDEPIFGLVGSARKLKGRDWSQRKAWRS